MKKVLAMVLAVVMVCTMAFAATDITATDITATGHDGETTTDMVSVVFDDTNKTFYAYIPATVFETLFKAADRALNANENTVMQNKFFTVTVNGDNKATWVASEKFGDDGYRIYFNKTDKALDGKVDWSINDMTITYKEADVNATFTFGLKDGKLVVTSYTIKGRDTYTAGKTGFDADVAAIKLTRNFDCGYAAAVATEAKNMSRATSTTLTLPNYTKADSGWLVNYTKKVLKASVATVTANDIDTTLEMTVAANAGSEKFLVNEALDDASVAVKGLKKVLQAALSSVKEGYTLKSTDYCVMDGFTATAPVTVTINANGSYNVYGITDAGKCYDAGFTYNSADKCWTYTGKVMPNIVVTTLDCETVAAPAVDGGTGTTNPATGANDVIGVAAALAVVALVSGAAISLKK